MNRIDIINSLISRYGYTSYLEIGTATRACFDAIVCPVKKCVDPATGTTQYDFNMTSDDFFAQNTQQFDLIFIDGLHTAEQVTRDVQNSLLWLNDGGRIVMHDCNPPTAQYERYDACGTVWKAVYNLRCTRADLAITVVDTEFGVGVIEREPAPRILHFNTYFTYELMASSREESLGLITEDEFLAGLRV